MSRSYCYDKSFSGSKRSFLQSKVGVTIGRRSVEEELSLGSRPPTGEDLTVGKDTVHRTSWPTFTTGVGPVTVPVTRSTWIHGEGDGREWVSGPRVKMVTRVLRPVKHRGTTTLKETTYGPGLQNTGKIDTRPQELRWTVPETIHTPIDIG